MAHSTIHLHNLLCDCVQYLQQSTVAIQNSVLNVITGARNKGATGARYS